MIPADMIPPQAAPDAEPDASDAAAAPIPAGPAVSAPASRVRHPCHICAGAGLTPPQLHRDWAHPSPHLHRDRARACHVRAEDCVHRRCICAERASAPSGAETGHTPSSAVPGMGSPRHSCARTWARPSPHLHLDLGSPLQICDGDRAFEGGTVSVAGNEHRLALRASFVQYSTSLQMWTARSWCRCGRGEPGSGADVAFG
jgi:hypothetical protein